MKVALVFLCALLGFAAALPNARIIGGHNSGPGQFPYMASLRSSLNNYAHFCGGSIHNTRYVLTAAHCTHGRFAPNIRVVLGTNSLTTDGVQHEIEQIVQHPNFNFNNLANDIALLRTETYIIMTPNVAPIALGTASIGSGVSVVMSGWGFTALPGYNPDIMQWLPKTTMSNTSCRLAHTVANRSRIGDTNVCTDNHSGVGNCNGDNGGPLVSGATIIGIFSWSVPCAQGVPDVYTRVASHAPWIRGIADQF